MILRRENCVILWISVKLKYLNIYKNFKYLNVTWPTKVGDWNDTTKVGETHLGFCYTSTLEFFTKIGNGYFLHPLMFLGSIESSKNTFPWSFSFIRNCWVGILNPFLFLSSVLFLHPLKKSANLFSDDLKGCKNGTLG